MSAAVRARERSEERQSSLLLAVARATQTRGESRGRRRLASAATTGSRRTARGNDARATARSTLVRATTRTEAGRGADRRLLVPRARASVGSRSEIAIRAASRCSERVPQRSAQLTVHWLQAAAAAGPAPSGRASERAEAHEVSRALAALSVSLDTGLARACDQRVSSRWPAGPCIVLDHVTSVRLASHSVTTLHCPAVTRAWLRPEVSRSCSHRAAVGSVSPWND